MGQLHQLHIVTDEQNDRFYPIQRNISAEGNVKIVPELSDEHPLSAGGRNDTEGVRTSRSLAVSSCPTPPVAPTTLRTTHTSTAHLPSLPSKQGAHAAASFGASRNAAAVAAPVAAAVTVVSLTHCATYTAAAQPPAVAATFAAAPSAV